MQDKMSKEDEKIWSKAKEIAESQGQEDNYAFIVSIFKKIKNKITDNEMSSFKLSQLQWTEEDNNELIEQELMQQVFPSPGGKYRVAKRFASWFPKHKTYVEPFAGGLACYFNKEKSDVEVVNDLDPDIANAYKFVRDCSEEEIKTLMKMNWESDKEYFVKLRDSNYSGKEPIKQFYRYMYLIKASYGGNRQSFGYRKVSTGFINRLPQLKERLKGTKIYNDNYLKVLKKYDGEETFFYLDPPYPDEWPGPEHEKTKLWKKEHVQEFVDYLKTCKSKFMVSLNNLDWIRKMFEGNGWYVMKTPVPRTFRTGMKAKYELLVTNYKIEGAPKEQLSKADNQVIVNSEIKKISEMIYKGDYNEETMELFDAIVGSLENCDLILKEREQKKEYGFSKELSQDVSFEKTIAEKLPIGKKILINKECNNFVIKDINGEEIKLSGELAKEIITDPRDFIIEAYLSESKKDDYGESNKIIYATDVFYLNEDVSNLKAIERKKYLKTISFSTKFRLNPFVVIDNSQIEKATKLFSKSLNSIGCLLRDYNDVENNVKVVLK